MLSSSICTQPATLAHQVLHFSMIYLNCVLCARHGARSSLMKLTVLHLTPCPQVMRHSQILFTSFSFQLCIPGSMFVRVLWLVTPTCFFFFYICPANSQLQSFAEFITYLWGRTLPEHSTLTPPNCIFTSCLTFSLLAENLPSYFTGKAISIPFPDMLCPLPIMLRLVLIQVLCFLNLGFYPISLVVSRTLLPKWISSFPISLVSFLIPPSCIFSLYRQTSSNGGKYVSQLWIPFQLPSSFSFSHRCKIF